MRRLLVFGLLLIVGCDRAATTPTPVTSAEGHYSVTFPGPPKAREESVPTPIGPIKTISNEWKHPTIDRMHGISYADYPVKRSQFDVKKGLDGAVEGAAKNAEAKVREDRKFEFGPNKLPAREVLMQHNTKSVWLKGKIILDTKAMRMYVVMVAGGKEYVTGPESDAFFESFALTK
jgi:hypothetical protein